MNSLSVFEPLPSDPPFSMIIRGQSRSGKTTFVSNLCASLNNIWPHTAPRQIICSSPVEQLEIVTRLERIFPSSPLQQLDCLASEHLSRSFLGDPSDGYCLIVCDDYGSALHNNRVLEQLFVATCTHLNCVVLLTVHSLYESSSNAFRTVVHNAQYIVSMFDSRAESQLRTLSSQVFGCKRRSFLADCLVDQKRARNGSVGAHVIFDQRPSCHDTIRVFSNIFDTSRSAPVAYQMKEEK